jgi:hypothetical protein
MLPEVVFNWREAENIYEVLAEVQRLLEKHDDDPDVLDYLITNTLQNCRYQLALRLDGRHLAAAAMTSGGTL